MIPASVTNIPFTSAFAVQSSRRNCSPAIDSVSFQLMLSRLLFFPGGMFLKTTYDVQVSGSGPDQGAGRPRHDWGDYEDSGAKE